MQTESAIQIKYIPLSSAALFDKNCKLHDIGAIAKSIAKNGFRNPPLWDANLNNGEGGIVAGNGRTETLAWMQAQGQPAPKGIAVDADGEWFIPVVFGCDADSEVAAQAFAIDDNLLTMAGANFTALDMSRLFDSDGYLAILQELDMLDMLPVTVDKDDLALLAKLPESAQEDEPGTRNSERKEIDCICPSCGHEFIKQH